MDQSTEVGGPVSRVPESEGGGPGALHLPRRSRRVSERLVIWLLIPTVLGVLVLVQTRLFRVSTCETYDEFTYLRMGICIYRHGDFKSLASPMCPPLPILLEYWLPSLRARSLPDTGDWESEVPGLIREARLLTSILVGVPLVGLVYAWLTRRRGWAVGLLGGGLVALSPTVLAAASIATTDACFALFAVLALAALQRYQVRPSPGSFIGLGAALGLALASKQSAIILFPLVLMVLLLMNVPEKKPGWTRVDYYFRLVLRVATRLAALVVLAFLVDWALYGFGLANFGATGTQSSIPVIVQMVAGLFPNAEAIMEVVRGSGAPLAIDTIVGQLNHASQGHPAFLLGKHSSRGWWYFFPVALALKSTPAELLMIGLVVFQAFRPGTWRDPARRLWLCSIAVMLGSGMCSSLNIGQRYMLLIYPLVVLLDADWLGEKAARHPVRVIAAGVVLLIWQAVSIVGIAPQYLSYFNTMCGGPSQGYRYLVDSSLDWGQDLPTLRRELEARRYQKVALCYFGTAKPAAYGLRSVDWTSYDASSVSDCDWLAISATSLQGVYGLPTEAFNRFRDLPSARVGYSIFLYDLKDPRVHAAWEAARVPLVPTSDP
jgi:4-amino-4-deoxy-L-arabinose transferase-like glycosyltransferase